MVQGKRLQHSGFRIPDSANTLCVCAEGTAKMPVINPMCATRHVSKCSVSVLGLVELGGRNGLWKDNCAQALHRQNIFFLVWQYVAQRSLRNISRCVFCRREGQTAAGNIFLIRCSHYLRVPRPVSLKMRMARLLQRLAPSFGRGLRNHRLSLYPAILKRRNKCIHIHQPNMCMYLYVTCMYVYTHICMYAYIYVCICLYRIHMYIYVYGGDITDASWSWHVGNDRDWAAVKDLPHGDRDVCMRQPWYQ